MSQLNLNDIINVSVSLASARVTRDSFNIGLIMGKSETITEEQRCRTYSDADGLLDDGFAVTAPEYLAARLYFAQQPAPSRLVVGRVGAGEEWANAIAGVRAKNDTWYACYCAAAADDALTKADHQAVAAYAAAIKGMYFYDDKDASDVEDVSTDVFSTLKAIPAKCAFGLYSATAYAGAAVMGVAMGSNTGEADSAFTLAYKSLSGVEPADLSPTQIARLKDKNANYYVTRSGTYRVLETGVMADGSWMDEVIGLDQLASDIQRSIMDLLTKSRTKIPYTDAGALQFVLACNNACDAAARRSFLAPGIWRGSDVLELEQGDTLEAGYLCQAESVANQPLSDKAERICPPIYICAILAGALHSATIRVSVE